MSNLNRNWKSACNELCINEKLILFQYQKLRKHLQLQCKSYFLPSWSFQIFTGPSFQIKLHLLSTLWLSGFQSSHWELLNPQSKVVSGNLNGSGRHNKCNCLQDQDNFHRSWAWQIILIFETALCNNNFYYNWVNLIQKYNVVFILFFFKYNC